MTRPRPYQLRIQSGSKHDVNYDDITPINPKPSRRKAVISDSDQARKDLAPLSPMEINIA